MLHLRTTLAAACVVVAMGSALWGATAASNSVDRMAQAGLAAVDVDAVDRALDSASQNLSAIWQRLFAENRLTYRSPSLKRYVANGVARCGPNTLPINNAFYCTSDDTIWYDPIFLARLKRVIAQRSKQPADNIPTIVIAHEWGHAVAARLGFGKQPIGTGQENDADCYAGASTRELINAGHLPAAVLNEARQLFELLGEPNSRATGSFVDLLSRSHGVVAERQLAFSFGADSGTKSCQNEKRYYDLLRKVQKPIK